MGPTDMGYAWICQAYHNGDSQSDQGDQLFQRSRRIRVRELAAGQPFHQFSLNVTNVTDNNSHIRLYYHDNAQPHRVNAI